MPHIILRLPAIKSKSGLSRSTLYSRISEGLWPKFVKIGQRSVGQPAHEVSALNAARISEKSDEEIRALVVRLEAARKAAA